MTPKADDPPPPAVSDPAIEAEDRVHAMQTTIDELSARVARAEEALGKWQGGPDTTIGTAPEDTRRAFQRSKLESLARLTGGVAHDFNNLLMVLSGNLHILDTSTNPDACAKAIVRLNDAVDTGIAITRRLLAFGRRQALREEVLDPVTQFDEIAQVIRSTMKRPATIVSRVHPETGRVKVDRAALEMALMMIVSNSLDAMAPEGEIAIELKNVVVDHGSSYHVPAGRYVEFRVSDTGTGMSAETLEHAFDPFFSTKPVGEGCGMGLSRVHGFCLQSGGTAFAESDPGRGTTIFMLLPRDEANHVSGSAALPDFAAAQKLLIVDDDADAGSMIAEQIEAMGFRATLVPSAEAAMLLLQNDPSFSLVFTDVMLPGGRSGYELAVAVEKLWPEVAVVLSTGFSGALPTESMATHVPLLLKPFRTDALRRVLTDALVRKREARTSSVSS